jgi:ribosomal-protein-alanine N-acetyltransferase
MGKEIKRSPKRDCLLYQNLTHSIPANIRFITPRDFKQIATIEHNSFEYPWLEDDFYTELSEDNSVCYVVEHNGFVAAYAVIKYHDDHIELCNIAVDKDYRRRKIATLIINMLKIKLHLEGMEYIECYVSEYNLAAQLFLSHKDNGFIASIARNHYCDGHDSYYMVFSPT